MIAIFRSSEPTPIQHIETQKIHPRTFHIDPTGRLLVAQHSLPVNVRDGDAVKTLTGGLSVFRIGDDGKLTFVRKYDIVDFIRGVLRAVLCLLDDRSPEH